MSDPRSDKALIKDYLAGDKKAFHILVKRYEKPLFRYANERFPGSYKAYWVVRKTFWSAYHKLRYNVPAQKFSDWLYRLCEEKCQAGLARQPRPREVPLPPNILDQATLPRAALPEAVPEKRPKTTYLKRRLPELSQLVKDQCLTLLNGPERLLYDLRVEQHQPYEEIAAHPVFKQDNASVEALMKRFSRILDKLREWLLDHHYIGYWEGDDEEDGKEMSGF